MTGLRLNSKAAKPTSGAALCVVMTLKYLAFIYSVND